MAELNEILLNIMPNSWSKQSYVQGFDCGYIAFKKSVDMFERIYIEEYIYEGVVEALYTQYNRSDDIRAGHSRKNIEEDASSHTYSAMSENAVNIIKYM